MCFYLRVEVKNQSSDCSINEITLLSILIAFPGFQSTLLPEIRDMLSNSQPEILSVSMEVSRSVGYPDSSLA